MTRDQKGSICLAAARVAATRLCSRKHICDREELADALLPGLWRRARRWKPGPKTFEAYVKSAAYHAALDVLATRRTSKDILDNGAVSLEGKDFSVQAPRNVSEPRASASGQETAPSRARLGTARLATRRTSKDILDNGAVSLEDLVRE